MSHATCCCLGRVLCFLAGDGNTVAVLFVFFISTQLACSGDTMRIDRKRSSIGRPGMGMPLLLAVFLAGCSQQTSHNGKTTGEWIDQLAKSANRNQARDGESASSDRARFEAKEARDALAEIEPDPSAIEKLFDSLRWPEVFSLLDRFTAEDCASVAPFLSSQLEEKAPLKRTYALRLLGRAGHLAESHVDSVIDGVENEKVVAIRTLAIEATAKMGDESKVLPVLHRLLDDPETGIRAAAIRGLGDVGPAASGELEFLLSGLEVGSNEDSSEPKLKEEDPACQVAIAYALGGIGQASQKAVDSVYRLILITKQYTGSTLDANLATIVRAIHDLGADKQTVADALVLSLMRRQIVARDAARKNNKIEMSDAGLNELLDEIGPAIVVELADIAENGGPVLRVTEISDGFGESSRLFSTTAGRSGGINSRSWAIWQLSSLGSKAKSAIPQLVRIYESGHEVLGPKAEAAIKQIDPTALEDTQKD